MKLSVERLKSINWKQLGIDHGEKIALGVVGLLVLLIVSTGTRWKTFQEKQPEELTSQVATESKALAEATWPVEEQNLYTTKYDVRTVYDNSYSMVQADPFRYPIGHPMFWPLHRRQEPIEEPQWLYVKELIATPGKFILELPPEGQLAMTDGVEALEKEEEEARTREAELKARFGTGGPQNRTPGDPMGVDPAMTGEMDPMMMAEGVDGMMGVETGPEINARGERFVSVVGVFPYREQLEKITNARHDPTLNDVDSLLYFKDFVLQRQQAKPGPTPWSEDDKDWETVDQNIAHNKLAETAAYAEDVVDTNDTEFVFTMPLPARLVGQWTHRIVGHPSIKTLTQKELEYQRIMNEQLVKIKEEARTRNADDAPGGFANDLRDMRRLGEEIYADSGMMTQVMRGFRQTLDPMNEGDLELQGIEGMIAEMPQHLLFRYLDFDVHPGQAYRYRVKLVIYNPHAKEQLENVAAPSVVEGKYRETPWSKPSLENGLPQNVALVPDDSKYFVADVSPPKGNNAAKATVQLYQWLSEVGTTAYKEIEVQAGQIIMQQKPPVDEETGELVKSADEDKMVEVLRPWKSFKAEPIELSASDTVIDLAAPPAMLSFKEREFHADLKLPAKWSGRVEKVDQMLVVNQYGELENRNPLAKPSAYTRTVEEFGYEQEPWEYLKKTAEDAMMMGDPMMGDPMMGLDMFIEEGGGAGRGGKGKKKGGEARGGGPAERGGANPSRRNRGRAANPA